MVGVVEEDWAQGLEVEVEVDWAQGLEVEVEVDWAQGLVAVTRQPVDFDRASWASRGSISGKKPQAMAAFSG